MDRRSRPKREEVFRLLIGTGAAVLEIDLELSDIVIPLVRRSGQGKFFPQGDVVRQGAFELHSAFARYDRKFLERGCGWFLDQGTDR